MMAELFSSFDPVTKFNMSLNWVSMMLILFFYPNYFWLISSRKKILWSKISNLIYNELKILLKNKNNESTLFFFSMFMMILFNNFLGLFPYIFTATSHMSMTLSLSLPIWLSLMIFGWIFKTNSMFSHLIPQNTPLILMPFMVIIETISNIMRPFTLSIRLSANMIAGHLLMILLSNLGEKLNLLNLINLIIVQNILLILESAVAIIQSYVFMILTTLYLSEIN